MKQWVILILSIIIVVLAGLWEINYLEKTSRYALSDIEYSRNMIDNSNFEMAKSKLNDLSITWNNLKKVWSMFIEHHETEQIDEYIVKYMTYIELENKEEAIAASKELERVFRHIIEKQKISIDNVI